MGVPRRLKPTQAGAAILEIVVNRHGSIQAAARAADVSEHTLRRRIYSRSARIDLATAERLESIGIPRALLTG